MSALPPKVFGAPRSAASRIADSATETCATTVEERGACGSGGSCTSGGVCTVTLGASQSMALRLIANEMSTTVSPSAIVLGCIGRRIIPPDEINLTGLYRPADEGASVAGSSCFGGGDGQVARHHL
ncbi:hypothetical protein ACVWW1_003773 [Bradyrhizobium sp. JR3.5]